VARAATEPVVAPRLLPAGERALLVECTSLAEALDLQQSLSGSQASSSLSDAVLGARTVLVVAPTARDLATVRATVVDVLESLAVGESALRSSSTTQDRDAVEIEVDYSGADLHDVARATGLSPREVVAAHTGTPWLVSFAGFMPGFAYLTGGDPRLRVPRRSTARVSVPAGSVALADEFSGIYPRSSPGGWQIIGTTDARLWDLTREPPALLTPGRLVRFVARGDVTRRPTPPGLPRPADTSRANPSSTPYALLEVLAATWPVLIQDSGRPGLARLGVGPSGAADQAAYRLGARLLGQGPECAALEILLGGLVVRAHGSVTAALTGAPLAAEVDGQPRGHAAPFLLRDGQALRLGRPTRGLRTYLSIRGGVAVQPVLGSRSRDTLSGIGPDPVVPGTFVPVGWPQGQPTVDVAPVAPLTQDPMELRGWWGPRQDRLLDASLLQSTPWRVSRDSDRVGIRLEAAEPNATGPLELATGSELPPEGLVRGAIQVPPGGRPVVFLSDHPVTGGYPVVAVLNESSVDLAAQAAPGQLVHLVLR
jgi:KipI family sensor histidine kinase inhibitor